MRNVRFLHRSLCRAFRRLSALSPSIDLSSSVNSHLNRVSSSAQVPFPHFPHPHQHSQLLLTRTPSPLHFPSTSSPPTNALTPPPYPPQLPPSQASTQPFHPCSKPLHNIPYMPHLIELHLQLIDLPHDILEARDLRVGARDGVGRGAGLGEG